MKRDIQWPKGRRAGRINGKTFASVWKKCQKEADKYVREKYPELIEASAAEKAEIEAIWAEMTKEQKERISDMKVIA